MQQLGENKVYALLNKIVPTLNGLLTVFVIIRTIPKEEFGLLTLINTFEFFVFAFSGGLIFQGLQKYAAEVTGNILDELVSTAVLFYFVLSLIPSLVIVLISPWLAQLLHAETLLHLLKWLPFLVISFWVRRLAYYILLAKEKVKEVFVIDLVPFIIKALIILILWRLGYLDKAKVVVLVIITANIGSTLVSIFYLRKIVKFRLIINMDWVTKLIQFGKYSLGTTIGHFIHTRTDTLMIAYFYNPIALAMYSAAKGIADFFRQFAQAANMIVLPRTSSLFAKNDKKGVRSIFYKGIIYSFILITPIALTILLIPHFILDVAYHGKYSESANILRMFALSSLISPLGTIGSSISGGIGKPNYTFIAIWTSVVVNVGLNLFLIPKFGPIGAAYGTFVAMFVGGTIITFLNHRKVNLSITEEEKIIVRNLISRFSRRI